MRPTNKPVLLILLAMSLISSACMGAVQPALVPPKLASGVAHSCLLTQNGQVLCWGQGASPGRALSPELFGKAFPVKDLNAISLDAGWYHTCAVTQNKHVECWGQNTNGQLGDGTLNDSSVPVTVKGLEEVIAVSAGATHSCALTEEGKIYCWGGNAQGQLGDGTQTDRPAPVMVSGLIGPAASVSTGLSYTCAILTSGPVECWGDFDFINGPERHQVHTSPAPLPHLDGEIEKVAAGDYHICALIKFGGVKCEGSFFSTGEPPFREQNQVLGELQGHVRDILAETDFTCVLSDSGKVFCWGDNYFDEIGDGTYQNAAEPKQVANAGDKVIALGGGHYTACALRSDGGVACWGDTSFGQLGDGTARWK